MVVLSGFGQKNGLGTLGVNDIVDIVVGSSLHFSH